MSSHGPAQNNLVVNDIKTTLFSLPLKQNKESVLLAIKLQLVFNGAVNNPDEVDVPAEKKHQESLSL